jgi:dGTP triphosphohydrolase
VEELAAERAGGPAASSRSRRMAALLPETVDTDSEGRPYLRLLRVLDCISAMTDGYAVDLYQKLKGISL